MKRRDFITLIGNAAGCFFTAGTQQSLLAQETRGAKIREVGFLYPGTLEASKARIKAFVKGLQEKGYVEDKNVALVTRITELHPEKLAPLAAELVHRKVDVILGIGFPPVEAEGSETKALLIVMLALSEV